MDHIEKSNLYWRNRNNLTAEEKVEMRRINNAMPLGDLLFRTDFGKLYVTLVAVFAAVCVIVVIFAVLASAS